MYSYVYTVQGKLALSTTASSLPRFSDLKKNSFIGNIRRVHVSRVLLLVLVDQFWRSSSQNLLVTPKSNLKFYGDRSFQIAAPRLWNSLTDDIRSIQNPDVFKNKIKTLLLLFVCLLVCFFTNNNTLFHIYIQRKNYKSCRKLEKKSSKITVYTAIKKKEKKKQTNKETANLNRTVKALNRLIYRAPPTVHFHRIVHSFKEGRFLIETISF